MEGLTSADRKSNATLHSALCFGLIAMIGVMYYLIVSGSGEIKYDYKSTFFIISAVAVLICILLSSKVYTTNINKAKEKIFDSYQDASANFRAANLARWSFVMGASLISVNLAFMEQNVLGLIPSIIGLLFLYASKMDESHFRLYKYD